MTQKKQQIQRNIEDTLQSGVRMGSKLLVTPLYKFMLFIENKGILALAIGVIIADMVKQTVNVLVDGLIRPFIGLFTPGSSQFAPLNVPIQGVVFKFGDILSVLLQTFIIFVILYVVLGWLLKKEDILGTTQITKSSEEKKKK